MERLIIGSKPGVIPRTGGALPANPAAQPQVQQLLVDDESAGQRLDNFLMRHLKGVPKTHIYRVIRSGEVRVNKGRAHADTRVAAGDAIRLPPLRLPAPRVDAAGGGSAGLVGDAALAVPGREFPVLFEDDFILAINKPAGVAVHGGSGVSFGVIEQLRRARPQARFLELVHRLDRETSGVLLLAKKRSALVHLQDQFRAQGSEKSLSKVYSALVVGHWPTNRKVIDVPLHKYLNTEGERRVRITSKADEQGRRSITLVQVLRQLGGFTLLDVTIKTGRTHQIRVHLASEGFAIAGDAKYGDFAMNKRLARGEAAPARLDRMFLHARRLCFTHPGNGDNMTLQAPLPEECRTFVLSLAAPITNNHQGAPLYKAETP